MDKLIRVQGYSEDGTAAIGAFQAVNLRHVAVISPFRPPGKADYYYRVYLVNGLQFVTDRRGLDLLSPENATPVQISGTP